MVTIDNPEEHAAVQRATTYVLAELDRVCTELGIRYVVYGGTAIGAVRHKGFIPWDDDVDVCLPRPDYDRLLAEAPAILGPEFEILASETDPDFPKTFGLLGLKGTEFVPGVAKNREYVLPIGVDLFPLDPIPADDKDFASQSRATWIWGRLLFLLGTPTPEFSMPGPLKPFAQGIMHLTHWTLRGARVKPRTLVRKWESAARRFEGSGSRLLGDYSTQEPKRWSASLDELFPAVRVPFENITVMLPRDYDAILTRGYGEYQALPPEDERVNHAPVRISFGGREF